MTNQIVFDSILSGAVVFFAMLSVFMIVMGYKHKNAIIKAIVSAQNYLKEHIENHSEALKKSLTNTITPDLEARIDDIKKVEKDSFNKLIDLFLDHSPAAIEMTPILVNNILAAHLDLLQRVDQMKAGSSEPVEPPKIEATVEEDPLDAEFQYKALIEQLRYEKQDFANKFADSNELIVKIYNQYKDKLALEPVESFKNLKISEISTIFKIEDKENQPQ